MQKSLSRKKRAVQELKTIIRLTRKTARQINRKIESLAQLNRMKAKAKERLIELYS